MGKRYPCLTPFYFLAPFLLKFSNDFMSWYRKCILQPQPLPSQEVSALVIFLGFPSEGRCLHWKPAHLALCFVSAVFR